MAKPRKQTYTMDMYLKKIKDKDIRDNADVQRMAGAWKNGQINELIFTVLTEDYIPPIILGEEKSSQLWIIDGLQRSSSLMRYRYGNYKVTSVIEDSIISYKAKKRDKSGNIWEDSEGNIVWEYVEFNIKNKTYEDLPDELKKRFNEYQVETIIHEECDMKRVSTLIKRYNNHTSMNAAQKAFTHIDNFAKEIRRILNTDFFTNYGIFTETEKINGTVERVVLESVMCMFHLDKWKTSAANIAKYLNSNANREEFNQLDSNLHRLEKAIGGGRIKNIFTAKDAFIWLAFYNKFVSLGLEDRKFIEFLEAFKENLRRREVDGKLFDAVDREVSTKDKTVILAKLHILETLLYEFLHMEGEMGNGFTEEKAFVSENVGIDMEALHSDMELYKESLKDLENRVIPNDSKLLDEENRRSLLAIVAYSYKEDLDLERWLERYSKNNPLYLINQKENYLHMRADLEKFITET